MGSSSSEVGQGSDCAAVFQSIS